MLVRKLLSVLAGTCTKPQKTYEIKGLDLFQTSDMLPFEYATVILRIAYFHANRYRTAGRNLQTCETFSVAISVAGAATARH